MFADPAPTAVTLPVAVTVATAVLELVQMMVRPVSTLPLASFVTAVACVVCPVVRLDAPSETATVATGAGGGGAVVETVRTACPVTPSLVATIFVVPTASTETAPFEPTVATVVLVLLQLIVRPVSTLPMASCSTAVACDAPPTETAAGESNTATVATGAGVTVALAAPDFPSLVAVMVTEPADTPVTRPEDETVATEGAELDQLTRRSESTAPVESFVVAVACVVPPTCMELAASETATDATGTALTTTVAFAATLSTVAVTFALPMPTARMSPESDTVATPALEVFQLMFNPDTGEPLPSTGSAFSRVLPPRTKEAREGVS